MESSAFSGADFRSFLRGTYVIASHKLTSFTTEKSNKAKNQTKHPNQNGNPGQNQPSDEENGKYLGKESLKYLGEYKSPSEGQIIVAGIPMPTNIENLHLLIGGSTGTGK